MNCHGIINAWIRINNNFLSFHYSGFQSVYPYELSCKKLVTSAHDGIAGDAPCLVICNAAAADALLIACCIVCPSLRLASTKPRKVSPAPVVSMAVTLKGATEKQPCSPL
jgi:hypothetical protein